MSKVDEILDDKKFLNLRIMLENPDAFQEMTANMDSEDLQDLIHYLRAIFNDFRLLMRVNDGFKKILKSLQGIMGNISLNDAIEKIVDIICEILECDRATIFLVHSLL